MYLIHAAASAEEFFFTKPSTEADGFLVKSKEKEDAGIHGLFE